MILALVLVGVSVVVALVVTVREWRWLRAVRRASGDPVALARLLGKRER